VIADTKDEKINIPERMIPGKTLRFGGSFTSIVDHWWFFWVFGPKTHMTKEVCFDKVYRVYRSTGSQDNHWSKPDLYTIQTIHFVRRKVHCPTRLGGESNQFTI
jgi:hypothetical protein